MTIDFLPCSGNIKQEPGAVVCRMSQSFVRFGSFQLPVSRGQEQVHLVQKLADYVIGHHYPHLDGQSKSAWSACDQSAC